MSALGPFLGISLRLHFRNRMALLYGYLFPLVFLAAFWVLYRGEKVPLLHHVGELLTITVLGGACFGLPTTLVSERERGVWRRYRLTPWPAWRLLASTVLARFVLLVSAGALQLAVAFALGLPRPEHPAGLLIAFTFVAVALMGLGLVLAMLADNVPAVQALGQCIFLPMLIIGGVAVPLSLLPSWTQHLSAFFPGRYAVEALQACMAGPGLAGTRFDLLALAVIGVAGVTTAAKLFRWDPRERLSVRPGRGWLALVLLAWLAVGAEAEQRGRVVPPTVAAPAAVAAAPRHPWDAITAKDVAALDYRVPDDSGVVSPIAGPDEQADDSVQVELDTFERKIDTWEPGNDADDLVAVRNLLNVLAVADVAQRPTERFLPRIVYRGLLDRYPKEKLVKILTWIAQHPEQGVPIDDISDLGIQAAVGDPDMVRERTYLYAVKFVARLTGRKTAAAN